MKKLWILPDAGLGNRLNCIYSGLYYRKKFDCELNILWIKDMGCNISFEEIFEIPEKTNVITLYNFGRKDGFIIRSLLSKIYFMFIKIKTRYLESVQTRYLYIDNGEDGVIQTFENNRNVCFKSSGPFCDKNHFAEVRYSLEPRKELLDRAKTIMEPYKGKKIVGIHIRRTDHTISIENSPLEKFIEFMDQQEEGTYFYLATDEESTRQKLESRYNVIPRITYSNQATRRSSDGMKDAYVEMLCLSMCDRIFGSYGSTFSMISAYMGQKRLDFAGQDSYWNDEYKLNDCLIASWMPKTEDK